MLIQNWGIFTEQDFVFSRQYFSKLRTCGAENHHEVPNSPLVFFKDKKPRVVPLRKHGSFKTGAMFSPTSACVDSFHTHIFGDKNEGNPGTLSKPQSPKGRRRIKCRFHVKASGLQDQSGEVMMWMTMSWSATSLWPQRQDHFNPPSHHQATCPACFLPPGGAWEGAAGIWG